MKYLIFLFLIPVLTLGNIDFNLEKYEKDASLGDEKAKFILGKRYYTGQGIKKDEKKALFYHSQIIQNASEKTILSLFDLYESFDSKFIKNNAKALEKRISKLDNPKLNCILAKSYYRGLFTRKDINKALHLYEKGAKEGESFCITFLSRYYFFQKDYEKAIKWIKEDTKANNTYSLERLAISYEEGLGVKKDINKANEIYKKLLLTTKREVAIKKLGIPFKIDLNKKDPKNYQKFKEAFNKKDYTNSLKYALADAKNNNHRAQYNVALHYQHGFGVKTDFKEAFSWYKKSADQNFHLALLKIAEFYYYAMGIEKDKEEALIYYRKAALLGNDKAKQEIVRNYRKKYVSSKNKNKTRTNEIKELYKQVREERKARDYNKALETYQKLYSLGEKRALLSIANIYDRFKDEEQMLYYYNLALEKHNIQEAGKELSNYYLYYKYDYKKALDYLEKANDKKNEKFAISIAEMYGEKFMNLDKTIYWYKKAAKLNSGFAIVKLDELCAYNPQYKCLNKRLFQELLK